MAASTIPATAHRYSLRDVVAAYGPDAVSTRITALRAAGCHRVAQVIEREFDQLELSEKAAAQAIPPVR
ncbi:hypothetical protein [Nocardia sp. NPDC051570]|uniref:hypothetical protein n=1 Tax=Nocardia sp. NPDC051570 TaxID=3364324 RepID=UPI0037BD95D4